MTVRRAAATTLALGSSAGVSRSGEGHEDGVDDLLGEQVEQSVQVMDGSRDGSRLTEPVDTHGDRASPEHAAEPREVV